MKSPEELRALKELRDAGKEIAVDFMLNKSLYDSFSTDDKASKEAERQLRTANVGTFDCYCTNCNKITPFISQAIEITHAGGGLRHGDALSIPPSAFATRAVCHRCLRTYIYVFQKIDESLFKIGQMPSMADISFAELKDIEKVLDRLDRKELGTALGLFAHGPAAGAFVYLRRVFERMIARAYARQSGIAAEDFDRLRMDEKIEALRDHLPEKVVRNKKVFSVLSVGVHELSDLQCKALFPLVKAVIFQMLEQEEHIRRKEMAERETDAAFKAILSAGFEGIGPEPERDKA